MTTKRREEYSTNVVRVLSPSRSPNQQAPEFDNNLEYLLEDLQASISRPGSSLGQNSGPVTYTTNTRDMQYLSPSNTTTIIRERSKSPNDSQRIYKTATYEYSTSGTQQPEMQQNIHQLDTLLSDLKHERDTSYDRNNGTLSNVGIDSGFLEPAQGTRVTKTTHTYSTDSSKPGVQRILNFESPDSEPTRQSRQRQRSPTSGKGYSTIERTVTTTRDSSYPEDTGIYGGIKRTPNETPNRALSPTDNYNTRNSSNTTYNFQTIEDQMLPPNVPYNEIVKVETTQGSVPLPLQDMQLSEDILPKPLTKVTTTVRTYTYEIPAEPTPPVTNKTIVYKNETHNTTTNTLPLSYPERDVMHQPPQHPSGTNQTIIYKTDTHHTTNTHDYPRDYPIQNAPLVTSSQPPTGINKTIIYKRDTSETTSNTYPQDPQYPPQNQYPIDSSPVVTYPDDPPRNTVSPPPTGINKTIIYKKDTRETTTNMYPPQKQYPPQNQYPNTGPVISYPSDPPMKQTYPPPTNTTIIYKEDITDTTRNVHPQHPNHPHPNQQHPHPPPGGIQVYPQNPNYASPPNQPQGPTTTYFYTHESSNTTNTHYNPANPGYPPNDRYPNDKYPNDTYPNDKYPNDKYPNDKYPNDKYPTNTVVYPNNTHPGSPPGHPDTNTVYTYTTNRTTRNIHGSPDESQPLMQPTPFPTDGFGPDHPDGYPPKRLDDLMATFGDTNKNNYNGQYPAEKPLTPSRDNNTQMVAVKPMAAVEPKNAARNIAGPAVYYPPGHEMFAKKEEAAANYRAQGGYERASGKYMYESESRSKSKSSTSATMVPVCLPLCCAMPCSIM